MNTEIFEPFAPAALMSSLGRCGEPGAVMKALKPLDPQLKWFRTARTPYAVQLPDGITSLMLQCINPDAPEDNRHWGVHSWTGQSRNPAIRSTLPDVVSQLGEPAFMLDEMAVFEGEDAQGQAWCAHCALDPGKNVRSITMMRLGDWLPVDAQNVVSASSSALPPAQTAPSIPVAEAHVAAPLTCRSRGPVPKTGWYEGLLPPDHPKYPYFSKSTGRFVRRHEGELMLTLGVVPFKDEELVVWTWHGEKLR